MSWSSTAPDGTKSVKDNRPILGNNTIYTETTMKIDHHWNESVSLDGHHNVIQQNKQDAAGVPVNPAQPVAPIQGKTYVRTVSDAAGNDNSNQLFFRQDFIGYPLAYQVSPVYQTGVANLTTTPSTILSVPKNVYGTIWIWRQGTRNIQTATFFSDNTVVEGFSLRIKINTHGSTSSTVVDFSNGAIASALNLQAARVSGFDSDGNYNWKCFFYGAVDI